MKRKLNNIDPTLGLINADGELIHTKWKAFKRAQNITSASMNVLLERPCRAPFLEECPQHHGHKGDPGVMPRTCGTIGERAQVILV